jgi:hypothetical protein
MMAFHQQVLYNCAPIGPFTTHTFMLRLHLSTRCIILLILAGISSGVAHPQKWDNVAIWYQSPVPGAQYVSPKTTIILRLHTNVDRADISSSSLFTVVGANSGLHQGITKLADDDRTILFMPIVPFLPDERVAVTFRLEHSTMKPYMFTFTIGGTVPLISTNRAIDDPFSGEVASLVANNFHQLRTVLADTLPLDFPFISSAVMDTTSPGRIFLSNFVFPGSTASYLLILKNSGAPLFYRKMPALCTDFKVQPNGLLTYYQINVSKFYAMDSAYSIVDSFMTGNGYSTDLHELRLLPNGHALLLAYDPQPVDMSSVISGGNPRATVIGLIVQETDQNKDVVFQWRSWDHFHITDATHENLTASSIDYVHGNAIELDTDGNLLISSRHMDEITKIDRSTGNIIWRLGGKNNEFTFINDSIGFSHQHAIRRLTNGNVTLFDNGNFHSPSFSRAVEYQLDETAKTATLVWQYRHTPDIYGSALGYVQRLENGNTLIGWGATNPSATEVRQNGSIVYEMTLATGEFSYRAYRFPWKETNNQSANDFPESSSLSENYPNPFNNSTTFYISLSRPTRVSLKVYNILGCLVDTHIEGEMKSAGVYKINFDGAFLASGIYFCQLITETSSVTRKMLLIK